MVVQKARVGHRQEFISPDGEIHRGFPFFPDIVENKAILSNASESISTYSLTGYTRDTSSYGSPTGAGFPFFKIDFCKDIIKIYFYAETCMEI